MKVLFSIIAILIASATILLGAMLTFLEKSVFYGIAIIVIGSFMYFLILKDRIKNKGQADARETKKLPSFLVCIVIACALFVTAVLNSDNIETPQTSTSEITTTPQVVNFENYDISIKEYYKSNGLYDENLLVVVYSFTNNSNSNICFRDAIEDKLFQNGVELDLYIATNIPGQVEIKDSWKDLKPGASFDVSRAYRLNFNQKSTVEINLSEKNGYTETFTKTITID